MTPRAGAPLLDRFLRLAAERPDAPAFETLAGERWSFGTWASTAHEIAAALIAADVAAGDRVAILAGNVPLWPLADLGILLAGGVSVGTYPTAAPAQLQETLADAGVQVAFVGDAAQAALLASVRDALPDLRLVVGGPDVPPRDGITAWAHWLEGARTVPPDEVESRIRGTGADQDAVLIYTSGSTGAPKGARLSHACVWASACAIRDVLGLDDSDRGLSFLPYCHAAERLFGLYTRIAAGMSALLVPDLAALPAAAQHFAPTVFGGVPRLFEKAAAAVAAAPGEEAAVLRAHFGGHVRVATSGGARLGAQVHATLARHGLPVLQAYGLTEHLCATMQRPGHAGADDVGPPMPGSTVRLADDGEILLARGALTFSGYHGRPDETAAAFTPDGEWLRTGDLGEWTATGALRITGRIKELIALAGGKKVAPLRIESLLADEPLVAQAVVFGEGERFLVALLTPDQFALARWAEEAGCSGPVEALVREPAVLDRVGRAVAAVNARLSRPEQVKRFALLPEPFTVEAGELTPTLKPRRTALAARHAATLAALFAEQAP